MKASLHTLGCKVNAYETDAMEKLLKEAGYEIVPFTESADVVVVNTCTVTNTADAKSRQMLSRARAQNPNAVVVAAGCFVQTNAAELGQNEGIDILIGNDKKQELPRLLKEYFKNGKRTAAVDDLAEAGRCFTETPAGLPSVRTRGYLKIQDGCDEFCSYCLIPYARGRCRTRAEEEILKEARTMVNEGAREIVLTGIHVSSYGKDNNKTLTALMRELDALSSEGLLRLRFSSLEPRLVTEDFLSEMEGLKTFCPHFHLSLQSGSDPVLKRMNRKYTTAEYQEACAMIRDSFSHPAITTDVITGFPGETEEEFEETRAFLTRLAPAKLHVFPFSERRGTRAAAMEGKVPEPVKKERARELISLSASCEEAFRLWYRGRETEVLLETGENGLFTGLNREYVRFVCETGERNRVVRGKVFASAQGGPDLVVANPEKKE
ncbi:MAG: tRNA (N(6)-L-threonylcarbamoyladenosine(37)-C(2))-methylthiotransferase MtaB [Lachnospiraceae bacterium]|nr:tRNA (N(6)-L-threonylcarbamoyladenosine(37)-C(2))-methylthiotransferase MtaB [Lachnospiraceae bacterium]